MRALMYDQQTSIDAATAITDWMLQFSGVSWTTRDVPACGLGSARALEAANTIFSCGCSPTAARLC
jgi:hypothetical protein